jgi:hypothetical protein
MCLSCQHIGKIGYYNYYTKANYKNVCIHIKKPGSRKSEVGIRGSNSGSDIKNLNTQI